MKINNRGEERTQDSYGMRTHDIFLLLGLGIPWFPSFVYTYLRFVLIVSWYLRLVTCIVQPRS